MEALLCGVKLKIVIRSPSFKCLGKYESVSVVRQGPRPGSLTTSEKGTVMCPDSSHAVKPSPAVDRKRGGP